MQNYGPSSDRSLVWTHQHAVIAGFGIVGRMVAEDFHKQNVRVTLVETNADTIERQQDNHDRVVHGDVRELDVLKEAGLEAADVLVLTIPDEQVAIAASQIARQVNPDVFIVARTNFFSRGLMASRVGADLVIVEEVATAHAMQAALAQKQQPKQS